MACTSLEWTLADKNDRSTWPPDRTRFLYVLMRRGYGDRFGSAWGRYEGGGRWFYIAMIGGGQGAWGGPDECWQMLWAPFPVPEGAVDDLQVSRRKRYVV